MKCLIPFSALSYPPLPMAQSCLSHTKVVVSSLWYEFSPIYFQLSCSLHSFSRKTSSIIPIHKMGGPLDPLASFQLIPIAFCVSKFFERSFYRVYSSFWNLTPFHFFLSLLGIGLTNLSLVLGRSLLPSTSKLLTLSGIPPFFINLFRLAFLLALLVELNLSFLIGACVVFQNRKSRSFRVHQGVRKDWFLVLYFSSTIILFLGAFFRQLLSLC